MADTHSEKFGRALRELRAKKGLSQDDLGNVIHRTYLSELERGLKSPTLHMILRLADALDVTPSQLVALATSEPSPPSPDPGSASALAEALQYALKHPGQREPAPSLPYATVQQLGELELTAKKLAIPPELLLSRAALFAAKSATGVAPRSARDALRYMLPKNRPPTSLLYTRDDVQWTLQPEQVLCAVFEANLALEVIHDLSLTFGIDIFQLLGLRNLSSTVGEVYARELCRVMNAHLRPNPNQDGYPDLIALTPRGAEYVRERERRGQMSDKRFWSPFPFGGLEVKATCGNTPPARDAAKPAIGQSRIPILVSAEWKAHHRETNNLVGIYWDFLDGLPTVLAVFYRNDLIPDDWGDIVQPKEGGGRTTSVSIMKRVGVSKMGAGWLVLPYHVPILNVLGQRTVFGFGSAAASSFYVAEKPDASHGGSTSSD